MDTRTRLRWTGYAFLAGAVPSLAMSRYPLDTVVAEFFIYNLTAAAGAGATAALLVWIVLGVWIRSRR